MFFRKKIGISEAVSRCSAGARTIERWLREAWDNSESEALPPFDENIDEIRFAIFYFSERIMFLQTNLSDKENDWLWEMIQVEGYKRAYERDPKKFSDPKSYGKKIEEIDKITESFHHEESLTKTFLHSLLILIDTEKDKIPDILEPMSDYFNIEHLMGYVMEKNNFFENSKLINDEEADELLEWMKNRANEAH